MGIRSFFSSKKKKNMDVYILSEKQYEDELTVLTDKLIKKSEEEICSTFTERIARYNSSESPLSKQDLEGLMKDLIAIAVSNRKLLSSYIERSISDGEIYAHYYNRMIHMNDLVNETYVKMKYMQNVQERYEYKKKIYNNITGNMYLNHTISASDSYQAPVLKDIGKEIDEVGGQRDEETSEL